MDKIKIELDKSINSLWKKFKKQKKEWCKLSKNLNIENYSKIYNQQYYLLKYFPAYFTEYFHIWKDFFEIYNKTSINIISIGCGIGIDFSAFKKFLDMKKLKKIKYQYLGVDIIDWKHKPKSMNFEQKSIKSLKKNDFKNIDLIIFPKILTELKDEELKKLAKTISNAKTSNELYFINSYITSDAHDKTKTDGINQFKIICKELKKKGYLLVKNKCNRYKYFEKQQGLRSDYNFFVYPNKIKDKLSSLKCNCGKCNISIFPMLENKYIAYNILKFVKNDN